MKNQFIKTATLFDIEIMDSITIIEEKNTMVVKPENDWVFERILMIIYEVMKDDSTIEPFWSDVVISSKGNKFVFYA